MQMRNLRKRNKHVLNKFPLLPHLLPHLFCYKMGHPHFHFYAHNGMPIKTEC